MSDSHKSLPGNRFDAIKADLEKALVSGDSFARSEIHRTAMSAKGTNGCDWCGLPDDDKKLYKYHVESDGGRKQEIKGKFCSKSCMEAYHG